MGTHTAAVLDEGPEHSWEGIGGSSAGCRSDPNHFCKGYRAPHMGCTNTAKPDLWVPLSPPQGGCTSPFGRRSPSQALFPARAGAVPVPSPQPCIPRVHLPQGPKATGDPVVTAGESTAAAAQYHLGFLGLWVTLANFSQLPTGPGLPPASAIDVFQ